MTLYMSCILIYLPHHLFSEYLDYIVVDKLYKLKHKDHGLKNLNSNYLKLKLTEVTFEGSI